MNEQTWLLAQLLSLFKPMNEYSNYLNQYFTAVVEKDEEEEERLLVLIALSLKSLVLVYTDALIGSLSEATGVSTSTPYEPSDEIYERLLANTMDSLVLMKANIEKKREGLDPSLSHTEVVALLIVSEAYQINRIIHSNEHNFSEMLLLDIVNQVYVQQGLTVTKTWVATIDTNTCIVCSSMNGITIPFHENFVYNGATLTLDSHYSDFANAHANCRCRIEYNIV